MRIWIPSSLRNKWMYRWKDWVRFPTFFFQSCQGSFIPFGIVTILDSKESLSKFTLRRLGWTCHERTPKESYSGLECFVEVSDPMGHSVHIVIQVIDLCPRFLCYFFGLVPGLRLWGEHKVSTFLFVNLGSIKRRRTVYRRVYVEHGVDGKQTSWNTRPVREPGFDSVSSTIELGVPLT